MESSKTSLGNTPARKERGRAAQGGTRGGQNRAQEEMEHKIPTFFTTMVEEIEAEFQPLHKLFQALEISENLDRRTEHLCKTCRDRESLDEHGDCTCCKNCGGSRTVNSCSCCEVCGKPEDSCPGCGNWIDVQFDEVLEKN